MIVYINGRFLSVPPTGVQVSARELLVALDEELGREEEAPQTVLLTAAGAKCPPLTFIKTRDVPGPAQLPLWEQTALPRAAGGGILVNLANSAPAFFRRNVVMFHDAQIRDAPASYRLSFRLWYRILQPVLARRACQVMTVSEHSADRLKVHGLAGRRRIRIVPNGVDHILRAAPEPIVAKLPRAFFLGFASEHSHKNMGMLDAVFARPSLAQTTLVLVGDPPRHGQSPTNVRYLGRVSGSQLRWLYETARGFLFPSLTEGFGLPPGEAMACGCPVISSPGGALGDVYRDAAMFADPDDPGAWEAAILRLRDSDPSDLVAAGRARATQMTWAASGRMLLDLIRDVAADAP